MADQFEPLQVSSADAVAWDDAADVVVVGFGGAGACAALEARENGAETVVIERFGGGGATSYSGGVIYAGGTRYQREAGYDDDADKMYAYLSMEIGDAVKPETLRQFCNGSSDDIEWLVQHGVRYDSTVYEKKTTFPPKGTYLYYSGNEKASRFADVTPPIPRGLRAVGPGFGFAGKHYFGALEHAVRRSGANIRVHNRATRLVIDEAGRVVGLEVLRLPQEHHEAHEAYVKKASPHKPLSNKTEERMARQAYEMESRFGRRELIRARGGVVLAMGSFAYNPEMLRRHDPSLMPHYNVLHRLATLGNDGSGIAMGQSVGGSTGRMKSFYIARTITPPEAQPKGIVVNSEGRRIVNEDAYTGTVGLAIAAQDGGKAWLILRSQELHAAIRQSIFVRWHTVRNWGIPALMNIFLGGTRRAGNLEQLARKCMIDPEGLMETAATHDRRIAVGERDELGKVDSLRVPLGKGPFYAIDLSLANKFAFTFFMTLGGLIVDETSGAVKREDGIVVEGLYAAGLTAMGLHSNGYISGIGLADGVFSGRRAARSAAADRTEYALAEKAITAL